MSNFISIDTQGLKKLQKKLDRLGKELPRDVKGALFKSGKRVETSAKRLISTGSRSGRLYKRGGVTRQRSARGEPPKTDSGFLVNSINTELKRDDRVVVGSPLEYAAKLENKLDRKFLEPSLQTNAEGINKLIADAVDEAINDANL